WTPDFISGLVEQTVEAQNIDACIPVKGDAAIQCSKDLATKEGIFVGISAGATFAAALEVAKTAAPGSNILCMLPDTGERYLSTPLFADVGVEMTAEEVKISRSSPNYCFAEEMEPA
ncbi:MAG: cysteine synthase, partial [Gammaproteobacteria bacterium]|nr:cysteine synthase [Gammaproteobacteria bacterium]